MERGGQRTSQEELTLELISEKSISKEAALLEPIWYSHLFDIPSNKTWYKDLWESKLRMREVGDLLTADESARRTF